jgi:SAM-dependent methyltransferase
VSFLRRTKVTGLKDGTERTLEEIERYWRNPNDGSNKPHDYLNPTGGEARSVFLLDVIGERISPTAGVLEVGCNVGRNLRHLRDKGWAPVAGIEINHEAVSLLREHQPQLADAEIINRPAEEALPTFADRQFGLVFTMAVLVHIHPDVADAVFDGMARVAAELLIAVEDEYSTHSWRHYPRNYRDVFESRGLRQVYEERCGSARSGLPRAYVARVFER